MFRLEFSNLQFNWHQAGQRAVVEQKINIKILASDLNPVFLADKSEILSEFKNELLQVIRNRLAEAALGKTVPEDREIPAHRYRECFLARPA